MALEKHQEPIQTTLWIASMQNGTRKNNWQPLKLKWDYKYDYPRCCLKYKAFDNSYYYVIDWLF